MIEPLITYQDISPDAKLIATYSGVNVEPYSDYQEIFNEDKNETQEFVTLEKNIWRLDGTGELFPEEPKSDKYTWGFVSSTISGDDGYYSEQEIPQLIVNYKYPQKTVALTLEFDKIRSEYPSLVLIEYWFGESLLDSDTYTCDTADGAMFVKEVSGYNRIVLKFLKTSVPYRRLRMINIYFGIVRYFGIGELEELSVLEEVNPISAEISINTLDFTVRNMSDIPFLFQKMQPIQLTYGDMFIGSFCLDESSRTAKNLYSISCIDYIGVIDRGRFLGGLYDDYNAVSLIDDIMDGTRIPYSVDDSFKEATVSGYIPICSKREALLYVCFVIGAIADTSRSDRINIAPLDQELKKEFSWEETFDTGRVDISSKITAVTLSAYVYTKDDTEKLKKLFEGILLPGRHTITWKKPCYDYVITGAEIEKSDVNYCVVNIEQETEVLISGREYEESEIEYRRNNPIIKLTDIENVVSSDGCRLVNRDNAEQILDRLYEYTMQTEGIETRLVLPGNIKVGDTVAIPSAYDDTLKCILTRVNLNFGATKLTGEVSGRVVNNGPEIK